MAQPCGAFCEEKWAREQLSGRVEGSLHVTVRRRSDGRMRLELCKDCKLYHCPFCRPSVYKPKAEYASVWTHIEIHRMRALKHGEFNIHSCHLPCRADRHFHCPYCAKTIITRKHFEIHMDKCQRSAKPATGVQCAASPATAAQPATTIAPGTILLLNLTSPFQQTITMAQCPAPPNPPAQPKSTAEQHHASPDAPGKPKLTSDQRPASPDPPSKRESTSDQRPASPDPPSKQGSTADQRPASPDPPGKQGSTADQHPASPDPLGKGKSMADQHPASPDPPGKQESTADQRPASPDPPGKQESTADQCPASPDPPGKGKSTADQRPASPDCLVEPTTAADQTAAPPDPPVQPTTPVVHLSTLADNAVKKTGQKFRPVGRKIKCPMCNLNLHKKNLRKHKLRKHLTSENDVTAKDHLRSQCIDSHNGVYAVAKSYKATAVPVHVIKKRSGSTTHRVMCGEDRCQTVADFRRRSGLSDSQCAHLRSVDFCFTRVSREDLKPSVLEELVANKWIGKDMKAKCLNHRDQAAQSTAPLVTLVDLGGSHCLYLSVFEPKVSPHSKLGRLFVTYTIKGRLWHCDCTRGRISCLHKCIAKWFLFQTNKGLFSSDGKRGSPQSIADFMEDAPAETSAEKSTEIVYPPGEDGLKQTAKYIYNQKKLPSTFLENVPQFESEIHFSNHCSPAETVCQECPGLVSLTEPVLITNRARIITVTGVIEDNSTFFKKCPDCEMIYQYQEWSEGLHNYNNHTILSLQLCILLRNSVKNQTADGGVLEVLARTIGDKSPYGMEVLQAYLHFEALTSHDCLSVVMTDLYQKGIFNMAGIEIKGLPESFTGEVNAEEVWDSVCMEIITSSLVARSSTYVATLESNLKEAAVSAVTSSFTLAERKKLSKQRTDECHRAVTRYLVKGLHPLSTADSQCFREMTKTLNPKYNLPSREQFINTLIPSWYSVEKEQVIKELLHASKAAVTCDRWTSLTHDHYLTVTLYFIMKGQMEQKVLRTKLVYNTQTDAEQIDGALEEFGVRDKVVAMTMNNAFSVDISIKKLQFRKLRCFALVLNLAAQKVYTSSTVATWAAKIRAIVVWIKRSSTAQRVLQEKQQHLDLQQNSLVLDVQTRWDSLYLMVERFAEQYAAIQATTTDPQIKHTIEKKRMGKISDDDHQKAEEFIRIMKPLYTSSLCVSADKSPTCSQIFPILKKLEAHFETQNDDTLFTATLKEKVWDELSTCYRDDDTWKFLQESSALDPRFKNRIDSDEIWYRVKNAAVSVAAAPKVSNEEEDPLLQEHSDAVDEQNDSDETPLRKRPRLSALEELFEEEDRALKSHAAAEKTHSIPDQVRQEIQLYRNLPAVPTSADALAWWWERRDALPLLSELSNSYLCVQASSTPHERLFSSAGDTISQERAHVLPEQADMQIFLQKNC